MMTHTLPATTCPAPTHVANDNIDQTSSSSGDFFGRNCDNFQTLKTSLLRVLVWYIF